MSFESVLDAASNERYGRQLLVKDFGVKRQQRLLNALVGAGGLGCPALLYLSGLGVGDIGIVDGDTVDASNLHRQVLHTNASVGKLKVESAKEELERRNPLVKITTHAIYLNANNALSIMEQYDVIVDASDNATTRYLINDVCVIAQKPLVSGSALGLEGQVAVYNYKGSPCYRCCYPNPTPTAITGNCSDNGVLGVVPGIIGSMQAMEVVKVITGMGDTLNGFQLMYDAFDSSVRKYKLPPKRSDCAVCGSHPSILTALDSIAATTAIQCAQPLNTLPSNHIMTVQTLAEKLKDAPDNYTLLDVRQVVQYNICHLKHSINIPLKLLSSQVQLLSSNKPIYVICRRGVDSVDATQLLLQKTTNTMVWHVEGGLAAWSKQIDSTFPMY
ncbi:hypothetical protein THRCLA_03132 [Thraustotheca clavata]|uniref:Rhodanese domain-containing protein n=1 Tax=Thraustotheca clavata TaxID=74557 RepID=A0A1W0A330_9STRA|nr:hypothetical protein THRCLA_03132 [Thraustotheca clavata]